MSDQPPKITHLFTRREFVPQPAEQKPADAPKVCDRSLSALDIMRERVLAGELHNIGFIGVQNERPMVYLVDSEDLDIPRLAALNVGVDVLKGIIHGEISTYISGGPPDDDEDYEDDGA